MLGVTAAIHRNNARTIMISIIPFFSEVLAFDRWQFNILDDRAPNVRNTVAWTVRMEARPTNDDDASGTKDLFEDSGEHSNHSQQQPSSNLSHRIYFGANRGLAVKAILDPQKSCITTALLLKRWKHPRIT